MLDDAHNSMLNKHVKHYQKDEFWIKHFVPQMTQLKRATIENAKTGEREGVWVVTGGQKNDHLRHADAYCDLAISRCGISANVQRMAANARKKKKSNRRRTAMTL